jgi:hypothetical protein
MFVDPERKYIHTNVYVDRNVTLKSRNIKYFLSVHYFLEKLIDYEIVIIFLEISTHV